MWRNLIHHPKSAFVGVLSRPCAAIPKAQPATAALLQHARLAKEPLWLRSFHAGTRAKHIRASERPLTGPTGSSLYSSVPQRPFSSLSGHRAARVPSKPISISNAAGRGFYAHPPLAVHSAAFVSPLVGLTHYRMFHQQGRHGHGSRFGGPHGNTPFQQLVSRVGQIPAYIITTGVGLVGLTAFTFIGTVGVGIAVVGVGALFLKRTFDRYTGRATSHPPGSAFGGAPGMRRGGSDGPLGNRAEDIKAAFGLPLLFMAGMSATKNTASIMMRVAEELEGHPDIKRVIGADVDPQATNVSIQRQMATVNGVQSQLEVYQFPVTGSNGVGMATARIAPDQSSPEGWMFQYLDVQSHGGNRVVVIDQDSGVGSSRSPAGVGHGRVIDVDYTTKE
eukprot:GFYU01003959.1.p1 GENE.GFYU01003959.1~~GFYU01003959.1.p1  ORF type:complete len:391 (-),score=47.56 GFYU01003959.1:31-1203(-)